jgi:hypothetical protein
LRLAVCLKVMDSCVMMTLLRIIGGHQLHDVVIQNTTSEASVFSLVLEVTKCHAGESLFSFVP